MVKQKTLPPKVLTPYMVNVYRALFAIGIVGMVVGVCGLAVLLDVENKKYWYSHTAFATQWMQWTEKNMMLTNICLNGGMLASVTSFLRLQAHSNGLAVESTKKKK